MASKVRQLNVCHRGTGARHRAGLKLNEDVISKRSSVGHEILMVTEAGEDGPGYKKWSL